MSALLYARPICDLRVILTYSKEELTLNSITLRIEACRGHITVLRGPISQVIRPALGVRCKGTTYLARHAKRRTAGIQRWISLFYCGFGSGPVDPHWPAAEPDESASGPC